MIQFIKAIPNKWLLLVALISFVSVFYFDSTITPEMDIKAYIKIVAKMQSNITLTLICLLFFIVELDKYIKKLK
jgi:hypothetical protein